MSRAGEPNPFSHRIVRWALWLAAGVSFGVLFGFLAGLSRPREQLGSGPVLVADREGVAR